MKKTLAIFVLLCMLFSFACNKNGGKTADGGATKAPVDSEQTAVTTDGVANTPATDEHVKPDENNIYTIADQVVYDSDLCTFKIVDAGIDEIWGFTLNVYIENKTSDKKLSFSLEDVLVNGYAVEPFWSEDVTAGKKANSSIYFFDDTFDKLGTTSADELTFTLHVSDADDWTADDLSKERITVYPTGLSADKVVYPQRRTTDKEFVAIDNEKLTFIILDTENNADWGYTLNCYLENKTDESLMFSWSDVSVNGFMADPFWANELCAHGKCYCGIAFKAILEENGITDVEQIEATLRVYSVDDWNSEDLFIDQITYTP